jgi:hypothetical protein
MLLLFTLNFIIFVSKNTSIMENPEEKRPERKPRCDNATIDAVKEKILRAVWDESAEEWAGGGWSENLTDRLKKILDAHQLKITRFYEWKVKDPKFAIEYYNRESDYYDNKAGVEVEGMSVLASKSKGMVAVAARGRVIDYYVGKSKDARNAAQKFITQEIEAESDGNNTSTQGFFEALVNAHIQINPNEPNKLNIETDHMGNPIT